jgi:hypothetical protein
MANNDALLLYRIMSGKMSVQIDGKSYYIVCPNIDDKVKAEQIYWSTYDSLLENDIYTHDAFVKYMIDNEMWSMIDESEFKNINKAIEDAKMALYEDKAAFKNLGTGRMRLNLLRDKWKDLYRRKYTYYEYTCEYGAEQQRLAYLLFSGLNKSDKGEFDYVPKSILNILNEAYYINKVESEQIRGLVKTDTWYSSWAAFKAGIPLFHDVINMSDEQKQLIYWAKFYDNIREYSEAPTDDIIEDDDILDGWAIFQRKKQEREKLKKTIDDKVGNKGNEVFIMAEEPTAVANIFNLNTPDNQRNIQNRYKLSKEKGGVNEMDLPDVKQNILMQATQMQFNK